MIAICLWWALITLWAQVCGVQGREKCGNPLLGPRGFNPPRPSVCSLRCATLTYYRLLAGERRGSVLFTEATKNSEYYCWFLSQKCQDEEILEMAFVMLDASLLFCQIIINPHGSDQQQLNADVKERKLLSPLCGQRFDVTLPFQKAQNAAEFCIQPVCPDKGTENVEEAASKLCPPFLVTLWYTQPGA
ncbi:hypothetical protein GDO81_010498 [Engystomops pustulosus]|uniref:Uncharacterized protein n=1 Tax=Engystomops pustulosus TaxID=76066 RepID=A0AAV7C0G6_ENGPU|nr:hypothetical protein GDO81_010498 [Engystomops pustulosus]